MAAAWWAVEAGFTVVIGEVVLPRLPTFRSSQRDHLILFMAIKFDQNRKHNKIPRVRSDVRNVGYCPSGEEGSLWFTPSKKPTACPEQPRGIQGPTG